MAGNYFTLKDAIDRVKLYHFRTTKENRMINALKLISKRRGVHKAKAKLIAGNQEEKLIDFNQALRELADIKVNPVTIPREWNIKEPISNLLDAFYRKIADEQLKKRNAVIQDELVREYFVEKHEKSKKSKKYG